MCLKMGHVGSKTRPLCQILEKPCVCSRGHIFSLIIMKFGQNVCLHGRSDEFENGSCQVKDYVTISNLRKTLYTLCRPHFQSNYNEVWSDCLSLWNVEQVGKWVMSGKKLGHQVKS